MRLLAQNPVREGRAIQEDQMRKFLTIVSTCLLVCGAASWSPAFETDFDDLRRFDNNLPGWKLGRGIVNMFGLPHEMVTHVTNNAIKGAYAGSYEGGFFGYLAGSANGIIAGFFPGVYYGVRRMTTGAVEVLTFWRPEYGPTIDPQYGSRNLAFTERDYFNENPYWYTGPPR
jgi:putative exosortase-associated protein (TIGR04073 family)